MVSAAVHSISVLALLVTVYPVLWVLFMSISTPDAVLYNKVGFFPNSIYLKSYGDLLSKPQIWIYYLNTIYITVIGTAINVFMTLITAYPLYRKDFRLRNVITAFMVFTMYFGGGLIPFYIQVRNLGLINTRWALIIPAAISSWNVIITRTYFQQSIPEELHDAACIDGASRFRILFSLIMPLAKPVMAVVALWSAVGFWNSYFWAMIFIQDSAKQPIQIFLMKLLIQGMGRELGLVAASESMSMRQGVAEQMKYVAIILTIAPILCVYPFVQKYFIRGIMIGALKG